MVNAILPEIWLDNFKMGASNSIIVHHKEKVLIVCYSPPSFECITILYSTCLMDPKHKLAVVFMYRSARNRSLN